MRLDATFEEADQALTKSVRVKYFDCPRLAAQRVSALCYIIPILFLYSLLKGK